MTRYLMLLTLTAGLTGGLLAPPPAFAAKVPQAGQLTVDDEAKAFTPEGIKNAESKFHGKTFKSATHFHVHTVTAVPEGKKKDFDAAKADKSKAPAFFLEWAREIAKADHDRGVFTFAYMSEDGKSFYILTIADSQTDRARGFDDSDGKKTSDKLIAAFRSAKEKTGADAQKARDAGLLEATNFVIDQLKNTSANDSTTGATHATEEKSGSSSIMSYVCIGIVALLGIWLVIGLIRAFTGGGGGGGGGYGGGGYGGGGGGGGFMTSMLGGMFGAAAGMYLYDQFAGHHGSDLSAGQSNDYGSTSADDGAGDFDGGSAGGGGDFGDAGGGGGDYGGGDFGGDSGGGDFGGGDF